MPSASVRVYDRKSFLDGRTTDYQYACQITTRTGHKARAIAREMNQKMSTITDNAGFKLGFHLEASVFKFSRIHVESMAVKEEEPERVQTGRPKTISRQRWESNIPRPLRDGSSAYVAAHPAPVAEITGPPTKHPTQAPSTPAPTLVDQLAYAKYNKAVDEKAKQAEKGSAASVMTKGTDFSSLFGGTQVKSKPAPGTLPGPTAFELKHKAGMTPEYWRTHYAPGPK
jgi:hypothetical protein